jgi:spermidine synthase
VAQWLVVISELIPEVVQWNHDYFGELTGHPLRDPRVTVLTEDVGAVMQRERAPTARGPAPPSIGFDAIMLDVDNGPEAFTREDNVSLYSRRGVATAYDALRPLGVLTVWSGKPSPAFTQKLQRQHFAVQEVTIRARDKKGAFHTVWVAVRTA